MSKYSQKSKLSFKLYLNSLIAFSAFAWATLLGTPRQALAIPPETWDHLSIDDIYSIERGAKIAHNLVQGLTVGASKKQYSIRLPAQWDLGLRNRTIARIVRKAREYERAMALDAILYRRTHGKLRIRDHIFVAELKNLYGTFPTWRIFDQLEADMTRLEGAGLQIGSRGMSLRNFRIFRLKSDAALRKSFERVYPASRGRLDEISNPRRRYCIGLGYEMLLPARWTRKFEGTRVSIAIPFDQYVREVQSSISQFQNAKEELLIASQEGFQWGAAAEKVALRDDAEMSPELSSAVGAQDRAIAWLTRLQMRFGVPPELVREMEVELTYFQQRAIGNQARVVSAVGTKFKVPAMLAALYLYKGDSLLNFGRKMVYFAAESGGRAYFSAHFRHQGFWHAYAREMDENLADYMQSAMITAPLPVGAERLAQTAGKPWVGIWVLRGMTARNGLGLGCSVTHAVKSLKLADQMEKEGYPETANRLREDSMKSLVTAGRQAYSTYRDMSKLSQYNSDGSSGGVTTNSDPGSLSTAD